ncbi:MAG: HEAT repeat domain-containing protein [Elusimicrobiota bacterium]
MRAKLIVMKIKGVKTAVFLFSLCALASLAAVPALFADTQACQTALSNLSSADPAVRRQAASRISGLSCSGAGPALLSALGDSNAAVRAAAADSLGLLRDGDALAPLEKLLASDADPSARAAAAAALTYLGNTSSAGVLIGALSDPDAGVRYAAARALGAIRSAQAVPALIGLLANGDSGLQRTAAASLGVIGGTQALSALRGLLNGTDPGLSFQAAYSLAIQRDASGHGALLSALSGSSDAATRQQAAGALAMLGQSRDLPALQSALAAEKDPNVKTAIQNAINSISSSSRP